MKLLKKKLNSSYSEKAYFFLPDDIDNEANWMPGELFFNMNKISFELFDNCQMDENKNYSTIHAFTRKGEKISFFNVWKKNTGIEAPGFTMSKYVANGMVVSNEDYIGSLEASEMEICEFTFSGMEYWMDKQYVQFDNDMVGFLDKIECNTSEFYLSGKKYNLNEFVLKNQGVNINEYKFGYSASFRLISCSDQEMLTLSEYKSVVFELSRLFSIFFGKYSAIEYIEFKKNEKSLGKYRYFFLQNERNFIKKVKSPLLSYRDFQQNYANIVESYFSKKEILEPIITNYTSDKVIPTYATTALINVARGLEMYHRNFKVNVNIKPDNYEETVEMIRECVEKHCNTEDELVKILLSNITYWPEKSTFNQKISGLLSELPVDLKTILFGESADIELFCSELTQTRNYYTHGDDKKKYKKLITDIVTIINYSLKLRCVLDFYILNELNLDESLIISNLKKWDGPYQSLFH